MTNIGREPSYFDSYKAAADVRKSQAKEIKESTSEIKTERKEQKEKLERFGKDIGSLKDQLKTDQPLTSSQREILKKTESIAKQLKEEKVALRSDVRDLGKDIRKAEGKIDSKMERIQSDAKKIDTLSQKETKSHQTEVSRKSTRIENSVSLIKAKYDEIQPRHADLNLKIETLNMQLNELRKSAQAHMNLSGQVHKEERKLDVIVKEFKSTAKGLKGESIPDFDGKLEALAEKKAALQKIQDEIAKFPLTRSDEGDFLVSKRREFQKVSSEIVTIKKEIQDHLDEGKPKTSIGARMAGLFSSKATPSPATPTKPYSEQEIKILDSLKSINMSPNEFFNPLQYTDFKKEAESLLKKETGERLEPDTKIAWVQKEFDPKTETFPILNTFKEGFISESEIAKLHALAKMSKDHPDLFEKFLKEKGI